MRISAPVLPGQIGRNPLVILVFFGVAAYTAYKVSGYILGGDFTALAYVAMAFVGGALVIAILNSWRNGLYFFLAWLLFEDFARKFLGNNMAIYFAKDFLLALVYLSFFAAYRRKDKQLVIFRPPFFWALLLFGWFGLMQVFNPASTHIAYGILGMKLYFYYIPLILIGYALLDSEKDLRRFFFANLVLILVIVSLGLVQSILGHTFLNPAAPAEDIRELSTLYRLSPVSGVKVYRPTSVFVSTGRFADFLDVAWLIVLGFTGYLILRYRRGRTLAFTVMAVSAAGAVMCTSRGVMMWCIGNTIACSIAFLWGAPWRHGQGIRVMRTLQRAALGIALAVVVLLLTFPDAFMSRMELYTATLDPRSPSSELAHRAGYYPWQNFLAAFGTDRWLYGYGIGTLSLGGQYVSRIFHVLPPSEGVESGFGGIVLEMGIGGLILWIIMGAAVVIAAYRVIRKLKGSPWFPIGFVIFWYAALLFFPFTFVGLQAYQDFVMNAYLWLMLGILFRLPDLALSSQFAASAPVPTSRRWIR
jgi:hypothetical protein